MEIYKQTTGGGGGYQNTTFSLFGIINDIVSEIRNVWCDIQM